MISFEISLCSTSEEVGVKAAFLFKVTQLIKFFRNVGEMIKRFIAKQDFKMLTQLEMSF